MFSNSVMARINDHREYSQGKVPLIDVEGTAFECGVMLGYAWQESLQLRASRIVHGSIPWWKNKKFNRLIKKFTPHIPDVFLGMAKGSGLNENQIGTIGHVEDDGCTSFAIQPSASLDGIPISGQSKDTDAFRQFQFQVLRLKMSNAPSALTLTYPGWLFGHGFVQGRCSIFRNALYVDNPKGDLPYSAWGLIALHCSCVDEVIEFTKQYRIELCAHCTVADGKGGVAGIEITPHGIGILKPKRGIYTHANCVVSNKRFAKTENFGQFTRENSLMRESTLRKNLEPNNGRLTAQLVYCSFCNFIDFPESIDRHAGDDALTTSVVIAEPTLGKLHVTRGAASRNWPETYSL